MTKEEIAAELNNIDRRIDFYYGKDYLIVTPYSDDGITFHGFINDEFGAWEGKTIYFSKTGTVWDEDECSPKYIPQLFPNSVTQIWVESLSEEKQKEYPETQAWDYKTEIPHARFNILEDGEIWGVGLVIDVKDLV